MKRREFIALLGGAATAWPHGARSQQASPMRLIGVLIPLAEGDMEAQTELTAFRNELQRLGWIEGRNARIETRWAGGDIARIQTYANELVTLKPDVILARTTPVTAALLRETRTIPIVFVGPSDPVGSGFAASMARPGGNATGFTNVEASLGGKWVELLKEIDPRVTRIAVVFDPKTSPGGGSYYLRLVQDAARSITVETIAMPVHDAAEIERVIEAFAQNPGAGLLVTPDVTTHNNRARIISLAARHHLPAVYAYQYYVTEGGLASYGIEVVDLYRRAATYVDRILRGERPNQLAVQAPVKFDLAINLKTARAIGLEISPLLLARADEVIE
jgi:putative ABC transport system substrate-binding protein